MLDEEEAPDTLVQSTFVISCASQSRTKGKSKAGEDGFPVLFPFEEDARASEYRKRAYGEAIAAIRAAFKTVSSKLFASIVEHLRNVLQDGKQAPGDYLDLSSPKVRAVACMGISPSASLVTLLRDEVEQRERWQWIHLRPRECTDLAAALRLLTARALKDDVGKRETCDLTDPASLLHATRNGEERHLCIFIESVSTFHYGALNDFIQAVHALSQERGSPSFMFILSVEGGTVTLDDKLDPVTVPLLDIVPIHIAPFTRAFELMVEELLMRKEDGEQIVWPSTSTMHVLRQQFYESWPDLDVLQSSLEVALHHHYTRRPLSVLSSREKLHSSLWTSHFFDRLRCTILDGQGDTPQAAQKDILLPVLGLVAQSKQAHLRRLLEDDAYLLDNIDAFSNAVRRRRDTICSAVQLVQKLRLATGLKASTEDGDDRFHLEPRKEEIGGLMYSMLFGRQSRSIIQDLRTAVRACSIGTIENVLEHVKQCADALGKEHKADLRRYEAKLSELRLSSGEQDDQSGGETTKDDEARISRVQKRLLREESSTVLKRELGDWLSAMLRSLFSSSAPLEGDVWTTSASGDYLRAILAPNPRVNILAALVDPKEYLAPAISTTGTPDICRVYQTYREAGRMINLADWFSAFRSSLKETVSNGSGHAKWDERQTSKAKRVREVDGDESSELSEGEDVQAEKEEVKRQRVREAKEMAAWNRGEMVHARFALAVHELGRMGFLKRTRRKPEHVLKLVHDLPPVKSSRMLSE